MGMGDEIMVLGELKKLARGRPMKWRVFDGRKLQHRWEDIWAGNPLVAHPGEQYHDTLVNHPGNRPYIHAKLADKWVFKAYETTPADIFLRPEEAEFAKMTKGRVIVHPDLKLNASPNKDWGFDQWERLVTKYPDVPWMQIGAPSSRRLPIPFLHTPSFRAAVGALKGAHAAVLQEGGLHHASAAVGLKAVVIFGGFISPRSTGYKLHTNLFDDSRGSFGCGMRTACPHCYGAMRSFSPEVVFSHLEKIL